MLKRLNVPKGLFFPLQDSQIAADLDDLKKTANIGMSYTHSCRLIKKENKALVTKLASDIHVIALLKINKIK